MSALRNQDTADAAGALVAIYKSSSGSDRQRAESYLKRMRAPDAQRLLAEAIAEAQNASAGAPPMVADQNPLGLLNGWGYLIDPDKDSVFTIANDSLGIQVPGTPHDLSAELNRMNAPRVLQSVTGDFSIEVKVSGQFGAGEATIQERAAYNGAGLLLMSDLRNYVRLERAVLVRDDTRQHYANFEVRINGRNVRFGQPDDFVIEETKDCFLRLERAGSEIRGAVRQDADADWHYLQSKEAPLLPQTAVGVTLVNSSDKPFSATFSALQLQPGKPAVTAERVRGD
jgi:regulation of enolase protein 1 (concanavalin A-like superfamily)